MSLRFSSFLLFLGLLVAVPAVEAQSYNSSQATSGQAQKKDKEKKQLNRKMKDTLIIFSITVALFGAYVIYAEYNRGVNMAQYSKKRFQEWLFQPWLDKANIALKKAIKEKRDDSFITGLKDQKKDLEEIIQKSFQRRVNDTKDCNFFERLGMKKVWPELFEPVKN